MASGSDQPQVTALWLSHQAQSLQDATDLGRSKGPASAADLAYPSQRLGHGAIAHARRNHGREHSEQMLGFGDGLTPAGR